MAEIPIRQVKKALLRKGFCESNSNHLFYIFYYKGKKTSIHTKISHSANALSDHLIHAMRHQMKLEKLSS